MISGRGINLVEIWKSDIWHTFVRIVSSLEWPKWDVGWRSAGDGPQEGPRIPGYDFSTMPEPLKNLNIFFAKLFDICTYRTWGSKLLAVSGVCQNPARQSDPQISTFYYLGVC